MASQAHIEDEILARRLQSEEFTLQQRQTSQTTNNSYNHSSSSNSSSQVLSDEELARRLDEEERRMLQRTISTSRPISTPGQVALQTGQTMTVRLHHPMTNRQIGEVLLAHHVAADEMVFELATTPGKYLKAKETGVVEFDIMMDNKAIFKVSNSPRGQLYLVSKAFINTPNRLGSNGWHLSMSLQGQLTCNGPRNVESEWMLLGVQSTTMVASPPPMMVVSNGAVTSSGAAIISGTVSPLANTTTTSTTQSSSTVQNNGFPGLGAGKDELMRFFSTPAGQAFLQQADYRAAYELYLSRGALGNILHRPDWPLLANRYTDYSTLNLHMDSHLVDIFVTSTQFKQFFADGYMTIPSLVPNELVREALKIANYWQFKYITNPTGTSPQGLKRGQNCSMHLIGDIEHDHDLLGLYYKTAIPHILQRMMGEGEVTHPKSADVISTFPCVDLVMNPALLGDKWYIDGFTSTGGHSPFNVLVGVALTDISEPDMGNFCIHPGSHIKLLDQYRQQAESKQTIFSANPYQISKPDLGEPVQLKLRAGDVFICSQRVAHTYATNVSASPTSIVYFRVSNVDHAVLKDPALYSLWLEFKYASNYMDKELENKSIIAVTEPNRQHHVEADLLSLSIEPSGSNASTASSSHYNLPAPALAYSNTPVPALPPPPSINNRSSSTSNVNTAPADFSHEALMAQPVSHFQVVTEMTSPVAPVDHQWRTYHDEDDSGESTSLLANNNSNTTNGSNNNPPRDSYLETVSFLHHSK